MINNIKNQTGRSLYLNYTKDTQSSFEQRVPNRYTSKRVASRFAQIGRSMIEMLGVLAIIGVLSVGGIAGYSKAMMKHKINQTIYQITYISSGIQRLFSTQTNYEELTTNISGSETARNILEKSKVIPSDVKFGMTPQNREAYINPFGNYMNIALASMYDNGDKKAFVLSYVLPYEACIALATQNWNDVNGFVAMSFETPLGNSECTPGDKVVCQGNQPMSVENAVKFCSKSTWMRFKFH